MECQQETRNCSESFGTAKPICGGTERNSACLFKMSDKQKNSRWGRTSAAISVNMSHDRRTDNKQQTIRYLDLIIIAVGILLLDSRLCLQETHLVEYVLRVCLMLLLLDDVVLIGSGIEAVEEVASGSA